MTTPELRPESHWVRVPHLAHRRLADEWIVLDLRAHRVYGLNREGGAVLEALAAPCRVGALDEALVAFLAELAARGLVRETPDALDAENAPALPSLGGEAPRLLWAEDVPRATHQVSPPQQITNPQCLP